MSNNTYGIEVQLEVLGRGTDRDSSVVLKIGADIGQGNVTGGTGEDLQARVALVELSNLGAGVVLVAGVASQRDGVASGGMRSSCDRRGIGEGQSRGGQGDKSNDSHCWMCLEEVGGEEEQKADEEQDKKIWTSLWLLYLHGKKHNPFSGMSLC